MGLRLGGKLSLGIGKEGVTTLRQHWDTADQVEVDLAAEGITDKPRPKFECPELTAEQLTTPDSKSYTETYQRFLSWYEYYNELKAKVQARVLQYTNMLDILSAQTRKQHRELSANMGTKKLTVEEVNDLLTTNPEYQEILFELQKYQQSKLLVDTKVDAIERTLRIISRQVEIRKLDFEQSRTASNLPSRGNKREPHVSPFAPMVGGKEPR